MKITISTPWAIIIAGALIGAAGASGIALTNRWAILEVSDGMFVRLDRWNGNIVLCGGTLLSEWEMPCAVSGSDPTPSRGPTLPPRFPR